jgi:hypothetical protein
MQVLSDCLRRCTPPAIRLGMTQGWLRMSLGVPLLGSDSLVCQPVVEGGLGVNAGSVVVVRCLRCQGPGRFVSKRSHPFRPQPPLADRDLREAPALR